MQPACPPHHWSITRIHIDSYPHDHHLCLRCLAEKDRPIGDSASMYGDRSASPKTTSSHQRTRVA